eukprot:5550232-Heterocapsa_arctica.AAC.1
MAEEVDSQASRHWRIGNLHLQLAQELARNSARAPPTEAATPRRSTEEEAPVPPGIHQRQERGEQVIAASRPVPHAEPVSHAASEASQ